MLNIVAFLLALLLFASGAQAQRLGTEKALTTTRHGVTIVTDPVRAGKKAQRFEVRPSDCAGQDCKTDRERAMVRVKKFWRYGSPQWIAFSFFLPPDFRTSAHVDTTVAMLHQNGGPTNTQEGRNVDLPVAQLKLRGDRFYADIHFLTGSPTEVRDETRALPLGSVGALLGRWTDVVIRFDTSGNDQILEVYLNGHRRFTIADLQMLGIEQSRVPVYQLEATIQNFIEHRPQQYNFQYGIYRAFVSRNGGPMPTQVIVIDEVRMGRRIEDVLVNERKAVD